MFAGHRASVWDDEKVLGVDGGELNMNALKTTEPKRWLKWQIL